MFGGDQNPFLHAGESKPGNPIWGIIQAIVIALAINVTIYFLFILPAQVDGPSMLPGLVDKEFLFANKIPTWAGKTSWGKQYNLDFKKGDIIIFEDENLLLVKRIIAKEGESIKIQDGAVYVNNLKLNEPYLDIAVQTQYPSADYSTLQEGEEGIVPADSYFMLGDNRLASKDSRYKDIGFVKRDKIKGIVFFRFWPTDKFGLINGAKYN